MQNFVHVSLGPFCCCFMYVWKWVWFWIDNFVCCMDQWNSNEVKSDCFGLILLRRFWSFFSFVLDGGPYFTIPCTWNYLKLAYNYCLLCTKVRSKALVYYPVLKLAYNYCLLCTKMPKSPIKINNSKQYYGAAKLRVRELARHFFAKKLL